MTTKKRHSWEPHGAANLRMKRCKKCRLLVRVKRYGSVDPRKGTDQEQYRRPGGVWQKAAVGVPGCLPPVPKNDYGYEMSGLFPVVTYDGAAIIKLTDVEEAASAKDLIDYLHSLERRLGIRQ